MPNIDETLPTPPADPNATLARPGDAPTNAIHIPGYDLQPEIARGGMGVVYAARDLAFGREVAIKVMLPGMDAAAFVREARITGRLPHPGIPPVYALGELPDGRPFLAMKLIRGDTLDKVLKSRGTDLTADRGRLLAAFEQMCHAVGYAHAQGIIHRDLKPSNIMVGAFGEVQVMDWGLAKETRSAEAGTGNETTTDSAVPPSALPDPIYQATVAGQIKGTPAYMAPEQARGEPVDARADVFALGGILAAILTGHPPFAGNSVMDTIIRAAQAELGDTFARLHASGADADLLALCKKCLAANRDDRFADATELAQAVAAYRAEVEARLLQAERERAAAEERRKRRFAQRSLAASVLLLLIAGGVGAVFAALWRTAETQSVIAKNAKDDALTEKDKADVAKAEAEKQRTAAEKAEAEAVKERIAAEKAEGVAVEQKRIAEQAKTNEEMARKRLAVFEYGGVMRVAHQEWRDGNFEGMGALLDGTNPQLRGWEWRYLKWLHQPVLLTLKGHTDSVNAASFSADGTRIVTGSGEFDKSGEAKVWDAKTGAELFALKGHEDVVNAASFSADGTRIVTASDDHTAKVWDAKSGAEVLTLKGHTRSVNAASFSADGTRIVTASGDKTAKVWEVRSGKPEGIAKTGAEVLTLQGHEDSVNAASFSADGTRIVTASGVFDKPGEAKVWDAKSGAELFTLKGHEDVVNAASFSADGTRIVTASDDQSVKVWDGKTGAELFTLKKHTGVVRSVSFSADGTRIITGGAQSAKVWDGKTGAELFTLKGHTGSVWSASFSADGTHIVTASSDHTAKVWNATTGGEVLTLKGHTGIVAAASFSADGTRIVTGSGDQTAKVWDAKTGAEVLTLKGHTREVSAAAFGADDTRIVTGSADGTAKVWYAPPPLPVAPASRPK